MGVISKSGTPQMISVIIPHYNDLAGLKKSLAALQDQDYPKDRFEIIVADNRSKIGLDAVQQAVGDIAHVVDAPVQGPGPARNAGVSFASGEILAFVDSDCLAAPGWLAEIASVLNGPNAPDVIGGDVRILPQSDHLSPVEAYEAVFGYRTQMYVERDHFAPTGNMAMRREIFEKVGPFGGIDIAEDMEWGQRAHNAGYHIAFSSAMLVRTPARQSVDELERKWDRHLGHEFAKMKGGVGSLLKWMTKACLLLVSPAFEWVKIAASDEVPGLATKWRGFLCLVRIRFYRFRKMIALAFSGDSAGMAMRWRDEK